MKRIIAILLSLIFCMILTACGDEEEITTTVQQETTTANVTEVDSTTGAIVTDVTTTAAGTTTTKNTVGTTTTTKKATTTTTTTKKVTTTTTTTTKKSSGDYKDEVLALVNAARIENGLTAVTLNSALCECAMVRAKEMAEIGDVDTGLSHTRPNGESCFTAIKGKVTYTCCGENIAWFSWTGCTSDDVMEGWMNSQGHRENILNGDFKELGIARADGVDGTYWCQFFIG